MLKFLAVGLVATLVSGHDGTCTESGPDIVEICKNAYLNFQTGGKEGLPLTEYWAKDADFPVVFPVPGWAPVKGLDNIMKQLGELNDHAGVRGFSVDPYEFARSGNKVFVFENVATNAAGTMKGLAVHTFNEEGKCVSTAPYHHSAKMGGSFVDPVDLVAKTQSAYSSFNGGEGIPLDQYWAADATVKTAFPVPGLTEATGIKNILQQFAEMNDHPNLAGFKVTPTSMHRSGNKVFVYEDIVTNQGGAMTGLAVHTFNEKGECVETLAFHDGAKMGRSSK